MKKQQNRKNITVKIIVFLGGKPRIFRKKREEWLFSTGKNMGKCHKTHGFSVEKAYVHILAAVCI